MTGAFGMKEQKSEVLGIDIGGTHMRFGLVDSGYGLTAFEDLSTREVFSRDDDPVARLAAVVRDYSARQLGGALPQAVSIGCPSTISKDRSVVVQTPNIPCIPDNFPLVEKLGTALGIPVFVNRDVNDLLLFDLVDLAVTAQDCVVGIYFGTGVGNAILMNGKLMLGKNGVAAELGHLPVHGNRRVCGCGNHGCLETIVSGVALERLQREHFPQTHISRLFAQHADAAPISDFVEGMAETVATEVNLFDPDCVILGGGLLQMTGFPRAALERAVHEYARKPYPEQNLDIRYSRPNQRNGVIGAAIYAYKRMADPAYL